MEFLFANLFCYLLWIYYSQTKAHNPPMQLFNSFMNIMTCWCRKWNHLSPIQVSIYNHNVWTRNHVNLNGPPEKIRLYFCILSNKKKYQGTIRSQELTPIGSQTRLGPPLDPKGTSKFSKILEPLSGCVLYFNIISTL